MFVIRIQGLDIHKLDYSLPRGRQDNDFMIGHAALNADWYSSLPAKIRQTPMYQRLSEWYYLELLLCCCYSVGAGTGT